MSFCELYKNGYLIRIKLTPNAKKNEFRDVFTDCSGVDYLKASVTVVPEKGKANECLCKLIAKTLGISVSNLSIISGATDHFKKVYIDITQNSELYNAIIKLEKEKA